MSKLTKEEKRAEDCKEWQEFRENFPTLPWKAWGSWFSWGSTVGLGLFFHRNSRRTLDIFPDVLARNTTRGNRVVFPSSVLKLNLQIRFY